MQQRILDQHGINFLTFTLVDWVDLFSRSVYCDILIDSLKFCQNEKSLKVHAYVIMSSHMHLILQTDNKDGLSSIIQSYKSYTAQQFLKYLKDNSSTESRRDWLLNRFEFNAKKHTTNSKYQVWQQGNHPVRLYSPKIIRHNLNYIHENPVVAGLVTQADHYRYSSASNYFKGSGVLDVDLLDDIWNDIGYIDTGS